MPYQDCFSCPACGEPICVALGETRENYLCPACNKIICVNIYIDNKTVKDPEPIDRRHIC